MTGRALVALQFVLIALLAAAAAPAFLRGSAPWGVWALALAGSALAAWAAAGWEGWTAAVALAVVLHAKSEVEERGLLAAHPGYAAYRVGTGRFVPRLR